MTITISFPQPAERLSMNDRTHWRKKAALTKAWRRAAFVATYQWMMRQEFAHPSIGPCFVRVTFPVKDNRRRDSDNPALTVKACVDGIVDSGLLVDDSTEWVETLGSRFAKGADVVVVELIPRTQDAA